MAALGIRSQLKLISVGVNLALPASPTNAYVVIDMSTQCSEGKAQLAFDQRVKLSRRNWHIRKTGEECGIRELVLIRIEERSRALVVKKKLIQAKKKGAITTQRGKGQVA